MRGFAARLLGSLVGAGLLASPAAGQITVVAGPTTTEITAAVGESVTVPIAVDMTAAPGVKLGAYRLSFRWNPALLRFVATAGGAFGSPVFNTDSAAQGVVKFSAAAATGATGIVNLGGVTLEVLSTGAADTFDLAFQELVAAETFTDLLPNLVLTSGVFCGGPVYGDVDGSGTVQALDAQIVLMYAVGLALPTGTEISRGDVDADSKVDPRDALVILSKVVGLDVSAFRVGRFVVAACQGSPPASLSIRPRPIALAQGDLFTASAEVRDANGNLLAGLNLGWSSSDTAVVKVGASGAITALAQGSAVVTAAVAPGITDTLTVTVGERHRWVVNPVIAAGQPSEIGSDLYPFSTIKQALDRAADGDTIAIGVATYNEPISTSKQLVFLGDSGAAGLPTISVPAGIAGDIARPGKQVIRRLRIASSLAGLRIRADSVELSSVRFESLKGPGLRVYGSRITALSDVGVAGALGAGIWIDSTGGGVVSVQRARVTGVDPVSIPLLAGAGYALHGVGIFARADSVVLDSVRVSAVAGSGASDSAMVAGVFAINGRQVLLKRAVLSEVGSGGSEGGAGGAGVALDSGISIRADSVILRRIGGAGIAIRGDSLRVSNAVVEDILGPVVDPGTGFHLLEILGMSGSRVGQVVFGELGGEARISRLQIQESYWSGFTLGAGAVFLDSVALQVVDQSGYACGLELDSTVLVAQVNNSRFEHAGFGIGVCSRDPVTTGDTAYHHSGYVAVRNSVIRGPFTAVHVHADSVLLENDSIQAWGWGIWQHHDGSHQTQWLKVRDVRLRGGAHEAIYADSVLDLEIVRAAADSAQRGCPGCAGAAAIEVYRTPSVRIDSSVVAASHAGGILVWNGNKLSLYGDTVTASYVGQSLAGGATSYGALDVARIDSVTVRGSVFSDNRADALRIQLGAAGDTVVVDSNSFRGTYEAIRVRGSDSLTGRVEIRRNSFKGSRFGAPTTQAWVELANRVIFAQNTLDSVVGTAANLLLADSVQVLGNVVTNAFGSGAVLLVQRAFALIEGNTVVCADTNDAGGIGYHAGTGAIVQNQVQGCYYGGSSFNTLLSAGASFDLTVRGNSFSRGTAVTPPFVGYEVQSGGYSVRVVGNTVTGGRYGGEAGLFVRGTSTYRNPLVVIDSNTVQGGSGTGIWVRQVDTLLLRGNTVTALDTAASANAAVLIDSVFASGIISRNVVTQNKVPGIRIKGQAAGVKIDTNLVADNTASGVVLETPVSGTLNSILRNAPYGLVDSSTAGGSVFQANNFEGNQFGVANFGASALDATNSWWGDPLGPTCLTGCDTSSSGDSVSTNVSFIPFSDTLLTAAPAGIPALLTSSGAGMGSGEPVIAHAAATAPGPLLPLAPGEIAGSAPLGESTLEPAALRSGGGELAGRGAPLIGSSAEPARPRFKSPLRREYRQ
ncbi:hypothetical protein HRbin33_00443 [bacterium HR33]|nr:hypothetical protein HRbin33_00443 [bacterium HR33]